MIIGAIALVLGLVLLRFAFLLTQTHPDFAPTTFANYKWVETKTGFVANEVLERTQRICLCGGYECDSDVTNVEPVNVSYEGFLHRSFVIVKDPLAGDDPGWGRQVWAEAMCLDKTRGESVVFTLEKFLSTDNAGTRSQTALRLSIQ